MSSWEAVSRFVTTLPAVTLGEAHEGSPAFYVGARQFARLRWH